MFDLFKEPGEGNLAWGYVEALFGSAPLGQAIWVVLACLMFLGSVLLAWFIIIGLVQSAYSGRVLGEKWNGAFAPARVTLGFALMTPLCLRRFLAAGRVLPARRRHGAKLIRLL